MFGCRLCRQLKAFGHFHDGEGFAIGEGQIDALVFDVAVVAVEGDAGEGGSHLEAGEAFGLGGLFAELEDAGADAAAGPGGVYEEGADFGGVGARIEEGVVAVGAVVGAVWSFAARPAAAGGEIADGGEAVGVGAVFGSGWDFDSEVGLVGNEMGIEAEPGADGLFDLGWGVVAGLEATDGGLDEGAEVGDVGGGGESVEECHHSRATDARMEILTSLSECGIIVALCAPLWRLMTTCWNR